MRDARLLGIGAVVISCWLVSGCGGVDDRGVLPDADEIVVGEGEQEHDGDDGDNGNGDGDNGDGDNGNGDGDNGNGNGDGDNGNGNGNGDNGNGNGDNGNGNGNGDDGDLGPPSAGGVFYEGNPKCEDLGFADEIRAEPAASGLYSDETGTVDLDIDEQWYFRWTSTIGIAAIIAKATPAAVVWEFDPDAQSGDDMHGPTRNSDSDADASEPVELGHILFCHNPIDPTDGSGI